MEPDPRTGVGEDIDLQVLLPPERHRRHRRLQYRRSTHHRLRLAA